jgi:cobalt-zinc-cadmium efflux system outer membrane protein
VTAENFRISGPTPFGQIYEVAVAYSERIELGGKRGFRTALADLEVEVAQVLLADRLRRGIAEVTRTYYAAVLALEKVDTAGRSLDAFDQLVEYNTVRFEEGASSESDLIKSRLEQVQFQAVLSRRELELRQQTIRLIEQLGETGFDRRTVVGELVFDPIDVDVRTLRAAALENRPDVLAARLEVERGRASLDL